MQLAVLGQSWRGTKPSASYAPPFATGCVQFQDLGVEEEPPSSVTWISAIQHVGVIAIFMIYPLIIGRAAGASCDQLGNMLRGWGCWRWAGRVSRVMYSPTE